LRSTDRFGRDDLLVLAKVLDRAHTWICDKLQAPAPPVVSPAPPPAAAASAQAQAQTLSASGDLVSVDSKAETLSVKTSTGEMTFKYNDETKITGSSKGAAGLATMTGSEVTVRYKKDGASNIATSIEVKAAATPRP